MEADEILSRMQGELKAAQHSLLIVANENGEAGAYINGARTWLSHSLAAGMRADPGLVEIFTHAMSLYAKEYKE